MAQTVGRNVAAPLLFLNLVLYFITLGFSAWCLNKLINRQTNHPSFGGNGATEFFLEFAILASILGIVSKFAGGNHLRAWRNDSLAAAGSTSLVAWAVTVLAFGFACKQINVGGHRGWRLRIVEAFIIILAITELLYLLLVHAGLYSSRYGPGYRDTDYGMGTHPADTGIKGTTGMAHGTRV
ncbi:membrane protein PM19L-like [Bidens hawaiensis]|uniref:membrane protein PM19L-like n=1 Tax=Bidens hawaiensis TaxID=980011 RepID=UPI00404A5B2C